MRRRAVLIGAVLPFTLLDSLPLAHAQQGASAPALAQALVDGSPWRLSNRHGSWVIRWRQSGDVLEREHSGLNPGVWVPEKFTERGSIVHPSTAGGNHVEYTLDEQGKVQARHSKNPSVLESLKDKS